MPSTSILILISHLHGDHFAGLPFLMLEYMWESPRKRILTIAGPRHLEQRTCALFHNMYPAHEYASPDAQAQVRGARAGRTTRIGPGAQSRTIRTPAYQARRLARAAR